VSFVVKGFALESASIRSIRGKSFPQVSVVKQVLRMKVIWLLFTFVFLRALGG
jgi:hypothetical protein